MGHLQSLALAGGVVEGWLDQSFALAMHLQSNHYPPLPAAYVGLCEDAIAEAAQAIVNDDDERWGNLLPVPEDVDPTPAAMVDGHIDVATAVRIFHLDAFVDAAIAEYLGFPD